MVIMVVKEYLLILLSGTCAAWISFAVVIVSINPYTAGFFAFLAFYSTLFLGVSGLFSLLGTFLRARGLAPHDETGLVQAMVRSLRQGGLLGFGVCLALAMLARGLFSIWMLGAGLAVLVVVEFLLLLWEERHIARVFRRG